MLGIWGPVAAGLFWPLWARAHMRLVSGYGLDGGSPRRAACHRVGLRRGFLGRIAPRYSVWSERSVAASTSTQYRSLGRTRSEPSATCGTGSTSNSDCRAPPLPCQSAHLPRSEALLLASDVPVTRGVGGGGSWCRVRSPRGEAMVAKTWKAPRTALARNSLVLRQRGNTVHRLVAPHGHAAAGGVVSAELAVYVPAWS